MWLYWQGSETHLVALDLALGVVLEMTVPLEASFDKLPELDGKVVKVVDEVVHPQARARRFRRVGGSDALLCCANALAAQLDLLEAVDNLVEVKDEVGPVREEEPVVGVETCVPERKSARLSGVSQKARLDWRLPFFWSASSSSKKLGT